MWSCWRRATTTPRLRRSVSPACPRTTTRSSVPILPSADETRHRCAEGIEDWHLSAMADDEWWLTVLRLRHAPAEHRGPGDGQAPHHAPRRDERRRNACLPRAGSPLAAVSASSRQVVTRRVGGAAPSSQRVSWSGDGDFVTCDVALLTGDDGARCRDPRSTCEGCASGWCIVNEDNPRFRRNIGSGSPAGPRPPIRRSRSRATSRSHERVFGWSRDCPFNRSVSLRGECRRDGHATERTVCPAGQACAGGACIAIPEGNPDAGTDAASMLDERGRRREPRRRGFPGRGSRRACAFRGRGQRVRVPDAPDDEHAWLDVGMGRCRLRGGRRRATSPEKGPSARSSSVPAVEAEGGAPTGDR